MTVANVEAIYRRDRAAMCKAIERRAGGPHNAEDIVQEAFTRALTYLHTFDENRQSLEKWITNIMYNCLKDFKRQERGSVEIDEDNGGFTPIELLEMERNSDEIIHHITSQDPMHRDVLYAVLILGLSYKAVHELYGVPKKTIDTIIYRFKKEFRS